MFHLSEYDSDSGGSGINVRNQMDKQARQEERQLISEQFSLRRSGKPQPNEVTYLLVLLYREIRHSFIC